MEPVAPKSQRIGFLEVGVETKGSDVSEQGSSLKYTLRNCAPGFR